LGNFGRKIKIYNACFGGILARTCQGGHILKVAHFFEISKVIFHFTMRPFPEFRDSVKLPGPEPTTISLQ